jgi:hypothetical protein
VTVNVVLVCEPNPPPGEEPVEWLLLTTLPIDTPEQVRTIVTYYCVRWAIETGQPDYTSREWWAARRSVAYHLCERAA